MRTYVAERAGAEVEDSSTTVRGATTALRGSPAAAHGATTAVCLALLAFLTGCQSMSTGGIAKPTAELKRFEVAAISLRDITFLFEVAVKNPYPLALPIDGMGLTFSVEGTKVFTAASQGGFSVPASGTRSNSFTVALVYADVIKVVKDYVAKDYLDTAVDVKLSIPLPGLPGLPASIPFSWTLKKRIPAIKPRLAVLDFKVVPPTQEQIRKALLAAGRSIDAGTALGALQSILSGKKPAAVFDPSEIDVPLSVSFTIELANEAKAALAFAELGYDLSVNGDRLVSGETTDVKREAARSLITVVSTFSSRSLSKNVQKLFQDRKGTFNLRGTAAVKLPDEIRKDPVPLEFEEGGSFSIRS
jgi:LEA14-like dessication related protein